MAQSTTVGEAYFSSLRSSYDLHLVRDKRVPIFCNKSARVLVTTLQMTDTMGNLLEHIVVLGKTLCISGSGQGFQRLYWHTVFSLILIMFEV